MSARKLHRSFVSQIPAAQRPLTKAERTRVEILEAAVEFLWTHRFRDLTIAKLMNNTSAGRSAFYQYFGDLYELAETLLRGLEADIFGVARPWLEGDGDPVVLLETSLSGLVDVTYDRGPILKAVSDASRSDDRLEKEWNRFLAHFDDAVTERIEQHQRDGLIVPFEARPIAMALNRMDASLLIQAFGSRPRSQPEPIRKAIIRIWQSTLYLQVPTSAGE
ncbi:TetR/AcrR family transcriptional regulator [Crateriforma conspicua]|uniref:HTH tetR-type domain-containing protein n=1 Tax=Crateriforma conspicua TaxID=2527996 RepID=A0A5C5Y247_9PLAN|nr:TetR/AcrR family transcriptional regulator [Crateriforma conspicua]TWT68723.1 hypothetical protein Pan14r_09700 [Crateriforma conspicua]